MSVEVVTVWAPRRHHEKWRDDYCDLITLQRRTVLHFGHTHTVVTDDSRMTEDGDALVVKLPDEVMPAMIAGVLERLERPVTCDLVFVDTDVLVNRDLHDAFEPRDFELALTNRIHELAPINNGVMLISRHGTEQARAFFTDALAVCGTHWGADQEAISAVAAPVPEPWQRTVIRRPRYGRIAFVNMKQYAVVPKERGAYHRKNPFMVHFKGATKDWAQEYAQRFIFGNEGRGSR